MKNRIQISFNQNQFETATATLQENVIKYRKLIDCIEKISGLRELQTLEQIEKIITNKTTFKNVLLSATLLEVSDEYAFIQSNHNQINLEVLEIDGENVTTKQTVIDQMKEDATTYLSDEFVSEYKILLTASKVLNELSSQNSSRFLIKSYDGKYSVSLQGLENSHRV